MCSILLMQSDIGSNTESFSLLAEGQEPDVSSWEQTMRLFSWVNTCFGVLCRCAADFSIWRETTLFPTISHSCGRAKTQQNQEQFSGLVSLKWLCWLTHCCKVNLNSLFYFQRVTLAKVQGKCLFFKNICFLIYAYNCVPACLYMHYR